MEANKLYRQLERDFMRPEMSDDWWRHMESLGEFVSDNFKRRSMGLVCDFAVEVGKVYTAVFPSNSVMEKILNDNITNAMLFVHHPMVWDIRNAVAFSPMNKGPLAEFRDGKISIFNFHVPLDNFGPYSTSASLARALGVEIGKPFAPYLGGLCGVFCKTDSVFVNDLKNKFEMAAGHRVGFYQYGSDEISNGIVAVVAGGGNSVDALQEMADDGVGTLLTGISVKNEISRAAHEFAQERKINLLGGTHYSTEKFACIAMVDYFKNLGLPAEFIADIPVMEDM